MTRTEVRRTIDAPLAEVFRTVSSIEHFSRAVPDIVDVEILSESADGVGTRFRETRIMNGSEAKTEIEVTEFEVNERVRLVSDSHGTEWDSVFTVREVAGGTELTLVMEARPHSLFAKAAVPLMKGMVKKALEKDMDAVKAYCERS